VTLLRYIAIFLPLAASAIAQQPARNAETILAGKRQFETRCAGCHGTDGQGGEHGAQHCGCQV